MTSNPTGTRIAHLDTLTAAEKKLVLGTTTPRLAELDEDALLDLLARVRRLRDKYVMLYRRQGSATVKKAKARAATTDANTGTAIKAEVFEDALGRISRRLASAARQEAARLRSERLAAARAVRTTGKAAQPKAPSSVAAGGSAARTTTTRAKRPPIQTKIVASTKAGGKRSQAKRDSR